MRHHVVIGCEHGQNDPSNEKASQDADREHEEIPGGEGHCVRSEVLPASGFAHTSPR